MFYSRQLRFSTGQHNYNITKRQDTYRHNWGNSASAFMRTYI